MLSTNICMLDFQPSSSEGGEEGKEEEEIPFVTMLVVLLVPSWGLILIFLAWQYDVMNPDGTYSSMPLTGPKHVANVPWPDLVCS